MASVVRTVLWKILLSSVELAGESVNTASYRVRPADTSPRRFSEGTELHAALCTA